MFTQLPWEGEREKPPFWMRSPGDSLIIAFDPTVLLALKIEFMRHTGLPLDYPLTADPLCGYPLPEVGELATDEPLARKIVNLEWFDHPVVWLRGDIIRSHRFHDQSQDIDRDENESEIALRLAIQLETTGYYQPKDGLWLSVADMLDVDLSDPFDLARIKAWQNGEPDQIFDEFDIGADICTYMPMSDALEAANDLIGYGLITSGVIGAYSLAESAERALESDDDSALINHALIAIDMGWDFCSSLMTDSEIETWYQLNDAILDKVKNGEMISATTARSLLTTALPILRHVVEDNDDVIDSAHDVIMQIREAIIEASQPLED